MQDQDPKEYIIDRIQNVTNILVTVENNPSVDELAAALALTLMLNKMDKHATAVFSGAVPPAISFLEPKKTFENTVDSLRDFIIALDKEKADRLRYKVEDDVVKIFITPYRSVITEKDLQFSQGDFNVEVIIALGVEKREDLDRAIMAHGRILHDATVVTINARDEHSELGVVDWQDQSASSICEMLSILGEDLKVPKLFDQQISTALLTGIVAATERFANAHTTPRVMNVSAQLMAYGANQQLIATNLSEKIKEEEKATAPSDTSRKIVKEEEKATADGEMKVSHGDKKAAAPIPEAETIKTASDGASDLTKALEEAAKKANAVVTPPAPSKLSETPTPLIEDEEEEDLLPKKPAKPEPVISKKKELTLGPPLESSLPSIESDQPSWRKQTEPLEHPTMSGTFNATTAEAEEANRRATEDEEHHRPTILSHGEGADGEPPAAPPPTSPPKKPTEDDDDDNVPPPPTSPPPPPLPPEPPKPEPAKEPEKPTASPEAQRASDLDAARQAINDALLSQPFEPSGHPLAGISTTPIGSVDHQEPVAPVTPPPPAVTAMPPPSPLPPPPPAPLAPANSTPPLPDFTTLPPLPPLPSLDQSSHPGLPTTPPEFPHPQASSGTLPPSPPPLTPPSSNQVSVDPNDPNLFHVPGQ